MPLCCVSRYIYCYTECHYAGCRYAESHDIFIVILNVVMLGVVMLNVVMPIVVMLNVVIPSHVRSNISNKY